MVDIQVKSIKLDNNYVKCPRCQHFHTNLFNFGHETDDKPNEKLCDRCVGIILKYWPEHESISYILANIFERGLTREGFEDLV